MTPQLVSPRCFFGNKEGHVFTNCEGWIEWVKEDPNNRNLCAKCHRGRHNARTCWRPRGVYWDTPYQPKKAIAATLPLPACEKASPVEELATSQPESKNSEPESVTQADQADRGEQVEVVSDTSDKLRELGQEELKEIASRSTCKSAHASSPEQEVAPETPRDGDQLETDSQEEEDDTWEATERQDRDFERAGRLQRESEVDRARQRMGEETYEGEIRDRMRFLACVRRLTDIQRARTQQLQDSIRQLRAEIAES